MSHTLVTHIHVPEADSSPAPASPACQPVGLGLVERAGGVFAGFRPETAVVVAVVVGVFLALLLSISNLKMRVAMLERLMMQMR